MANVGGTFVPNRQKSMLYYKRHEIGLCFPCSEKRHKARGVSRGITEHVPN